MTAIISAVEKQLYFCLKYNLKTVRYTNVNTIYDLSLTTYDLRFTIYRLSDFDTYNLRFWSTKCSSKFIGCQTSFCVF